MEKDFMTLEEWNMTEETKRQEDNRQ